MIGMLESDINNLMKKETSRLRMISNWDNQYCRDIICEAVAKAIADNNKKLEIDLAR